MALTVFSIEINSITKMFSVYSVWHDPGDGFLNLEAVVTDEDPPPGKLLDRMPSGRPPAGERWVYCMAAGLPEETADDLARAYVATMETRATELGARIDTPGIMAGDERKPSLAALALKHSSLRWPKKKRNADLRTNGYDPDGEDGKTHRIIFHALISRP